MRTCLAFLLGVAACSKSATTSGPGSGSGSGSAPIATVRPGLAAPEVAIAAAVAENPAKVPVLIILDDKGLRVAEGPATWDALGTFVPGATSRTIVPQLAEAPLTEGSDMLGRLLRESVALERSPHDTLAQLGSNAKPLDVARPPAETQDDAPPPAPEADGSGDTRHGPRDDLARQQAIDQARQAGVLGNAGTDGPIGPEREIGSPVKGGPQRQASLVGEVPADGKLSPDQRALVLAAPTIKATALLAVVSNIEGMIAVRHHDAVRPLRLDFLTTRFEKLRPGDKWIEVRIGPQGLAIEDVPAEPIVVGWAGGPLDSAAMSAAWAKLGKRNVPANTVLDVLVDPATDAQRLVDVLVAVEAAGYRWIGVGKAPTGAEAALRGHPAPPHPGVPVVKVGDIAVSDGNDAAPVAQLFKRYRAKLTYCYEKELLAKPGLEGTLALTFTIQGDGKAAGTKASGVDAALASCVVDVINDIVFSRPRGGKPATVTSALTYGMSSE